MKRAESNLKSKNLRNKILAAAIALLALIIAMLPGADGDGDITSKLIVVAMAIDYEDGEIKTTVSAAVPKPGSSESSSVVGVPVSAKGGSVAGCLSDIERKTGKSPETGLCGVIIIGDELAKRGINTVLSEILSDGTVSPGAYLAQADGCSGEQIINRAASLEFDSATVLTELMTGATKNTGAKTVTLLQFVSDSASLSKCATVPLVSIKKADDNSGGAAKEGGDGGNGGSGSDNGKEKNEPCEIDTAALYKKGVMVGKLDKTASRGLSYFDSHTRKGALVCPDFVIGGRNVGTLSGEISSVKLKNQTSFSGGKPKSLLKVKVMLKGADRERVNAVAMDENLSPEQINDAYKRNFERQIESEVRAALDQSRALGCDVFETEQKLYRFHTDKYKEFIRGGGNVLGDCEFEIKAEITVS